MRNISALHSLGNTFSSHVCRELCPEGRTASWVALSVGDWVPGWQKRPGDGLSVPPVTTATDMLSPSKLRREGVLARVTCLSQFRAIVHPLGTGVRIAWAFARAQCSRPLPEAGTHLSGSSPLAPARPKCTPCPSRLLLQTASKCRAVTAALSPLTLCLLRLRKNN